MMLQNKLLICHQVIQQNIEEMCAYRTINIPLGQIYEVIMFRGRYVIIFLKIYIDYRHENVMVTSQLFDTKTLCY